MNILDRPTLVLNKNWQPVGVAPVHKALVKVWNEGAKVVDPQSYQQYTWEDWADLKTEQDDLVIKTRHSRIKVPEVIVLQSYDKLPQNAVTFSRRNIYKRDRYTCQFCGKQPGSEELTIDHVIPKSRNGQSTWENCVLACVQCNAKKADRTPEEAKMPLRNVPHRPMWKPIYASHGIRIKSWEKFISEAYWQVELET